MGVTLLHFLHISHSYLLELYVSWQNDLFLHIISLIHVLNITSSPAVIGNLLLFNDEAKDLGLAPVIQTGGT